MTISARIVLLVLLVFHSQLLAISTDLLYDIYPFVRVYKDGRVERFTGTDFVPASIDPTTGAQSKDIEISHNVSARIYLPKNSNKYRKIPLLVYFHGGAFFTGSPFNQVYQNHLNSLVSKANVVAVSVNYRLAPEHPLPVGYEDSWAALKWVISHSKGNANETWLKDYADFGHVYLGGDSAGGNIAHNVAMRVGLDKTDQGIVLDGMFLNSPHFWGKKPIGNENKTKFIKLKRVMESIWIHAYPNSTGLDDPLVNPAKDPNISSLGCKRVLIIEGGNDILKGRGFYYKKSLIKSKWNGVVKVVDVKGEGHDFGIGNSPKAKEMVNHIASFLNQGEV
ncbi:hypothetical protein ACJIZ3_001331 [Penstemon smallii]|uniref:Alpha/beta hydrolase fold-3 domain-containing protein n=1 Tax=Penstemon smallii TaxID=265156 RepID=A0ABD3U609_9LAMI